MPLLFYALMFGSAAIVGVACSVPLMERARYAMRGRVEEARRHLDAMYMDFSAQRLESLHLFAPVGCGLLGWLLTGQWMLGLAGAGVGLVVPRVMIQHMRHLRKGKFQSQLVDALLLLSSSLRAGLGLLQSFTVVAEEMPPPISQEFGLLLKETRMGVSLEEAMRRFRLRDGSDDTALFTTAVLVGRETGGDVTAVFTQLVETLRERKKIRERIKTLTFLARMQGLIMAMLPVLFSYVVYTMDRTHFTFFLSDPFGKLLLVIVVVLQIVGAALFFRFSRSPL